ncbi:MULTISPECIES: L-threonylcarbamoyladenylate synthase [unclassified Dysgonomonas]|uniref:L-threonylcarbamoyladenylate synthase n=1 Tax=unclassified Dysgonomonas TaxID=2630389 RepID=UPI0024743055|nr:MULTISPECIES: L-threonylcarbamoyladenylate synthase [unclassified Dysgonomonas]
MREDIKKACEVMNAGGLILYPTDTIWGIGCDATNPDAVKRVYQLKQRTDAKALIVLADNPVKLDFYIDGVPDIAWDLIEATNKPLTIIYDKARNLAHNLIADDGSIGIRITDERFSKELCQRFRKAVVSTSANVSGEASPRNFSEIADEIKNGVDYVVQYRQNDADKYHSSSIIKLGQGGQVKIIRE